MKALLPRAVWFMLILGAFYAAGLTPAIGQVATPKLGAANSENINTIFMPAPRALRQQLNRAQAAIAEERYADAVESLGGILSGESADPELKSNKGELIDDFFLPISKEGESQTSLKTQALQMLGAMPEKGRRLYELNFGADARAKLDAALADGNIPKLTEVARRYFHTKAGYEAAILLGRLNLDQGRPLAAALAFKRVAEVPTASAQYDPELSLLLATSWQFAGQPDKAKETLIALRQRNPEAKIASGSKPIVLFERDDDALDWLTKLVGGGGKTRSATAVQWVMFRGNETRTASTGASLPLLSPRWTVPAVDDPQDAIKIRQQAKSPADRVIIPSLQPLVVNDYVIYRTADRVMGASLQDQGKRVWYFPWDESAYDKATRTSATQPKNPITTAREQQLDVRIWKDHPYGEMSSDGNQVFLIDEIGFPAVSANNQMQRVFIGGRAGGMFANPFNQQSTNKLAAIDLTRQGALNWKVGGESGEDDQNLAGAFFLGPPLPLAGQLFVLAEFNGEVRLLCLNAKTGMLEWKQSLAMMQEGRTITLDNTRRLAGATPSFAEGVLVCPTSGEGVAAVDLATRTLRWGYQYPRLDAGSFRRFNNGFQVPINDGTNGKEHWIDGSVTISDGTVLLSPIESMDLHCLDLLSGKPKWKPLPCEDMLFIGCVHDGKAILVGKRQVKAISLADGKEAWASPIELNGDAPSGRGYYSDHYYYLPTSSSQLLKIDLNKREIAAQVTTGSPLGNLVCYKDELISQSPDGISSFYLAEPLRKRTEELLAKNPNDSWALARRGEILLQDGKQEEALSTLRKAQKLAPNDAETKGMLARAMLSLLRADFAAHQALAVEAEPLLADHPTLRREFYRLRAQAMERAGSPVEAFAAYIALRDQPSDGVEMEELSREHSVRRERWISARLAALYGKATPEAKPQMESQVQTRLTKAKETSGPAALADFVDFFRFHPLAVEGQLELARRYVEGERPLEAELAIGELATHGEPTIAGRANAVLAAAYEAAGRFELARERYEILANKFSAVICIPGKTGKDLAEEAAKRPNIQRHIASRIWPTGDVESKVASPQGSGAVFSTYRYLVPITEFRGAASRGLRGQISPSETVFRAFDSSGKVISTTSLARSGQQVMASNLSTGKAMGHLMLVASGGEIMAVDALRIRPGITSEGLLWRTDTTDGDPNMRGRIGYATRPVIGNPLLPSNFRNNIQIDRGQGTIGVVTGLGITYLRGRQLVCAEALTGKVLWERTGLEPGSDVFGDEQKIVVIAPGEKSEQALVYSAIDGTLLDRRMVDKQDRRWATCGRNVLAWEAGEGKLVHLRLYDATNQGVGLWSKDVNQPTKGFIIDGEELALLEPSGKFTVISLKSGKELMSANVDPEPELQSIAVIGSREQYLLATSQPQTGEANGVTAFPLQNGGPIGAPVHGKVYAFDRATGAAQWQTPAFVSQHALPPDQPFESPVLVFARRKNTSRGSSGGSNTSSLLVLDRRDGSVIFEDDAFLSVASTCDTMCDRESRTVTIQVAGDGNRTLTLKFTDNPTPPRPPAQLGIMSSASLGVPRGTIVDVAADVFRALNGGGNQNGAPPPALRVPLRLPGGLPVPVQPPR